MTLSSLDGKNIYVPTDHYGQELNLNDPIVYIRLTNPAGLGVGTIQSLSLTSYNTIVYKIKPIEPYNQSVATHRSDTIFKITAEQFCYLKLKT